MADDDQNDSTQNTEESAEQDQRPQETQPEEQPKSEKDKDDELGDAGKQALDRMKTERNTARRNLREWTALAKELDAKTPEDLRRLLEQRQSSEGQPNGRHNDQDADQPEQVDVEKVRREAHAEAQKAANERILRAEVRSVATGKLSDPSDALRFLDLSQFEVSDDGEVDEDEISGALADLVKKKPYLAAQREKRFAGSGDGGAKPSAPQRPRSLGEAVGRHLQQT